jgi:ADP-ribose pyrophosphatase YjhB (NUDIX family)
MLGVTVAVIDEGRILLTKREDFEVWCLPGGGVDPGESVAQAAIREAREETGLEVRLTRLVGIYSRPLSRAGGMHLVLFAGIPVGGRLQPDPNEVVDASYFERETLPEPMLWGHRQQALDALRGLEGLAWSQNLVWPFDPNMTREELYTMRDQSGISRQSFYLRHFPRLGPKDAILEVGSEMDGDR